MAAACGYPILRKQISTIQMPATLADIIAAAPQLFITEEANY
jgi:hypothetical protein